MKKHETEELNNVRRLAYALYCATGDSMSMKHLAHALTYDLKHLEKDIYSLEKFTYEKVREEEKKES